jgi:hypothetical protein
MNSLGGDISPNGGIEIAPADPEEVSCNGHYDLNGLIVISNHACLARKGLQVPVYRDVIKSDEATQVIKSLRSDTIQRKNQYSRQSAAQPQLKTINVGNIIFFQQDA